MNWKNEAIERLSKYTAMSRAIDNIPIEIQRLEQDSVSLRGVRTDKVCRASSPSRQDDVLIGNIIKQELLHRNYENARMWVRSTDRALSVLSQEEKTILERMYINPQRGVVSLLCQELGMEQSSIYRKRDQALYHFTIALYGIS